MAAPFPIAIGRSGNDVASVRSAIGRAASRTGVDFGYLLNQARSESGLDPTAQARTSSAGGLFQFIDQSWLGVIKQHGQAHGYGWAADAIERRGGRWAVNDPDAKSAIMALRGDPEASALMAGEFASDNAAGLERALGRAPNRGDLYLAHFLGLNGATRFLKARDANGAATAAAAFPVEARANRGVFFTRSGAARSLDEVYALMAGKVAGDGAPVRMAAAMPAIATRPSERYADARLPYESMLGGMDDIDLMKPTPQQATLAYLLIAGTLPEAG